MPTVGELASQPVDVTHLVLDVATEPLVYIVHSAGNTGSGLGLVVLKRSILVENQHAVCGAMLTFLIYFSKHCMHGRSC